MSVIHFDAIEIKELLGMVKFHEEILIKSLGDDLKDAAIISKTLSMALIANRIAYAVQYSEPETFHLDDMQFRKFDSQKYFTKEIIKPIECQKEELAKKLSRLHYNLYTNNGAIFLEDKYTKNVEKMIDCLKGEANGL